MNVSATIGLSGVILTIAESPVFRVFGLSSVACPVLGSILAISSLMVAAVWEVARCSTGVYPGAMAVG